MPSIISAGTSSNTALNFSGDTSGVLQLASNTGTAALTIDTSQNVGIGTASPGQRLDVQGASGDVRVRVKSNGGGGGGLFVADGDGAGSFPGYQTAQSGTNYWTIGQRGDTNLYMNREAGSGRVIVPTGSFQVATTIGVGGATPSASGAGITFPATQSASTDANTLDDYEEGTFTPTVAGTSTTGTASYFQQVGSYTKIGNVVTCNFHLNWSGGTGTGNFLVIGLPFLSANNNNFSSPSFYYSSISYTSGNTPQAYLQFNDNRITFEQVGGGATSTSIAYDAAGVIVGTLVYRSA